MKGDNRLPRAPVRDYDFVDVRADPDDKPWFDLPDQADTGERTRKYRVLDEPYDASLDLNREKFLRRKR